jgi:hypothetical protein
MATKAIARRRSGGFARRVGRRAKKTTVSLSVLAGFAPTAAFALEGFKLPGDEGGVVEAAHRVTMRLTGYEWKGGVWVASEMFKGIAPLLLGAGVHKLANKMGINRMIANAGIPIFRI